jgi:hypothetical protein
MTPIQTYGDRTKTSDPYAAFGEPSGRNRSGRRGLGLRFNNLENAAVFSPAINVTAGLASGSLSSIRIFISHSRVEHLQGLAEMLRCLESARVKADPYVEIDETIRSIVGKSFEHRLAKILEIGVAHQSKKKASLDELLEPVLQLEKHGRIDSALDALYDRVDDLLKTEEFETLDGMLRQAKVESLSADVLLGLLTATLPARAKLPARANFFAEAEASIKARGEWENGLLAGLES